MTNPVAGQVWIDFPSDPQNPHNWRIYDAATGSQIVDAESLVIEVHAGSSTSAYIRRMNQSRGERYDLVGKPTVVPHDAPGVCAECADSGFYESPISGRKSPCSKGCQP